MIEPEIAWCDLGRLQDVAEEFIKHIFRSALDNCGEDMAFFNERIEPGVIDTLEHIVASEFERITYTEAVDLLGEIRRVIRISGQLGHRPAVRARALPYREDFQTPGDRD